MATVIDALVVELGLDPAKFTKGQNEAMESLRKMEGEAAKRGKAIEQSAAGIEQGFAAVQRRLLGVAALLLGGLGIEQFIQRVTKLQVATANLGQVLGITSQSLQTWSGAAERFGIAGTAAQQGLGSIQGQRFAIMNGNPMGSPLYNMSMGTQYNANPANRLNLNPWTMGPEQQAMEIARWLENSPRKAQDAAALTQQGQLSQDFVAMLMKGTAALKKTLEEASKNAPTDQGIQKFKELNDAFEKTAQHAQAVARRLVEDMVPALVKFLGVIDRFLDMVPGMRPGGDRKWSSPEEAARALSRLRHGKGSLDDEIRMKEAELKANEEKLRHAQGIYRRPLENEQQKLIEELRRLREALEKERGGYQKQSFDGGTTNQSARLIQTAFSGGGAAGGGGVPGMNPFGGSARGMSDVDGRGGGLGGTPDFGQQAGPLHGPQADFLKEKRAAFAEELKDPNMRRLLGAVISSENQGAGPAVAESLFNRTEMVNEDRKRRGLPPLKLRDMILGHPSIGRGKSFYGPIRRGEINNHLRKMGDPRFGARMNKFIDQALEGSDLVRGHTDQGSAGDPNYISGGVGVNINRERFNDWGYRGSREWRQRRQREQAPPTPPPTASDKTPMSYDDSLMGATRVASASGSAAAQNFAIGDIHVHKPVGDAEELASNVKGNVRRMAQIMSANYGPA